MSDRPQRAARARTRNVARRNLDPTRQVAHRVLRAVDAEDAYANLVLPRMLREAGLSGRDAAFATELAYGTLRGRGTYDAVIAACIDRPISQVDAPLLDALRLGTHQLLSMRVAVHAAVSSTVDLVRADVGQGAAGFANAVLRRVAEADLQAWLDRVAPQGEDDPDRRLSVVRSHPVWIVRAMRDGLRAAGRDPAELDALLAADNLAPSVAIAALPGLAGRAELTGAGARPGTLSPVAVLASGAPDALPAVRQARARVQDEGSQVVALALAAASLDGPDTGRWLDLAAGPGGKAALLAAVLGGRLDGGDVPAGATLLANEVAPHRTRLVEAAVAGSLARHPGLVRTRTGDARTLAGDLPAAGPLFDRVLLDAPCTGLGALRRRPEARWRRTPADLGQLGPLQRDLLRAALDLVRPGGVAGYVTCSPHPAETRLVVEDVLRRRDDVERLDARDAVAAALGAPLPEAGDGPDVQLWPHVHGTDAMYLALLRRRR